ncbi:MAG: hypothetical protein ABI806_02555 [Candidatus Solibacter sp.]
MRTAVLVFCSLLGLSGTALAQSPVLDFESLPEGQAAGAAIAGVSFTNATVLQSAASLNEAEFPPRSGNKVVCDIGGPIKVTFNQPVKSFTAYITHSQTVTLKMVAPNGGVITQTTAAGDNRLGSGKTPNEAVQLTSDTGFTQVELSSAPGGSSFTVDDITTSLFVPPPPKFFTDITSLTFDYVSGRLAPPPMSIFVSAEPDVAFTVTTPTSWIQAITSRGITPANVSVAVHPEKFEPGQYFGTVVFTNSKNEKITIPVTVRVGAKPSLYSSPVSFTFKYRKGDAAPASQLIQVGALSANVDFFVLTKDPWVKVTPDFATTGHLDLNQRVSVDVSKLEPGHYESAIYVYSNEATNSPLGVPVILDVTAPATSEANQQGQGR